MSSANTDDRKRNVIHLSTEAHASAKAIRKATGKTMGTIVEELVLEEVALRGTKSLSNKAIEAQSRRKPQ